MAEHTPVTETEAKFLYELGWESGFGWEDQLDWYWTPSNGPSIWIEDDKEKMRQWLVDRRSYQMIRRVELVKAAAAPISIALGDEPIERVVICLHACAGIPTEALEGGDVQALVEEFEETVKFLETFYSPFPEYKNESWDRDQRAIPFERCLKSLRAALAPFQKGQTDESR